MPIDLALSGRHPIKVVAARTGVPATVLRTWERRYGAVKPKRTEAGRRVYSDEEIRRLSFIRAAVDGGRSVGDVATLSTMELQDLVEGDQAALLVSQGSGSTRSEAWLSVLERDGVGGLARGLRARALEDGGEAWRHSAIQPLLEELADQSLGLMGHRALEEVRGFIEWVGEGYTSDRDRPKAAILGREGAFDDVSGRFGALLARQVGWDAPFLSAGAGYPLLAGLQESLGAGLIIVVAEESRFSTDEIAPLIDARRRLPDWVDVAVAGRGAKALKDVWIVAGVVCLTSLDDVQGFAQEVYERRFGAWTRGGGAS